MISPVPRADDGRDAFEPIGRLTREALPGRVSEDLHRQGRERLLATLALEAVLPPRRPAWILAVAAAIGALALALVVGRPRPPLGYAVEGGAIAESGWVATTGSATVRFADGSDIGLAEGARARLAEVGPKGARLVLEDGEARVRVVHRPGAAWSIVAGPFAVAVTGTAFEVRWSAAEEALEVRLHEGAVRVDGPLSPAPIALAAGQRLVASAKSSTLRVESLVAEPGPSAVEAPGAAPAARTATPMPPAVTAKVAAAPSAAPPPPARSWSQRVAAGEFAGVVAEAEARGADAILAAAPLADLAALADAARYVGRSELSRRALLAERARFAGSAEATAAAFLLGRIADDAQGSPASAIALYEAYLAEAPSGPFAAEALGRRMVALRRTSGAAAAKPAAEDYLRRFPDGAHARAAREIAGAP